MITKYVAKRVIKMINQGSARQKLSDKKTEATQKVMPRVSREGGRGGYEVGGGYRPI